jgi:tripartite-type tricarboxylate transporter receptor subunit TctC
MELRRRQFLHLAAGVAALPAVSRIAWAQTYPTRPIRWIVGFPPGGLGDIVTRPMGQWLSERLGQPFIIENRPGAAGNIATEAVVHAPADGYTLLLVNPGNATSATFYDKLSFNFIRDIAPVAGIVRAPIVIEVNPLIPVKTIPEFIAYANVPPSWHLYRAHSQGRETSQPSGRAGRKNRADAQPQNSEGARDRKLACRCAPTR